MSDYASLVLLPPFLRHLAKNAPFISCDSEGISSSSFRKLERGDLDFCLAPGDWRLYADYRPSPEIQSETLFEDDFVCIFDADHPDIADEISMEVYMSLPHNSLKLGGGLVSIVERGWAAAGVEPHIVATASSFSCMLFMLPGTRIVATAQRRLGRSLAGALGLRMVECPFPLPKLQENLTWHQRNEDEPGHRYLRDSFRSAAAALSSQNF